MQLLCNSIAYVLNVLVSYVIKYTMYIMFNVHAIHQYPAGLCNETMYQYEKYVEHSSDYIRFLNSMAYIYHRKSKKLFCSSSTDFHSAIRSSSSSSSSFFLLCNMSIINISKVKRILPSVCTYKGDAQEISARRYLYRSDNISLYFFQGCSLLNWLIEIICSLSKS